MTRSIRSAFFALAALGFAAPAAAQDTVKLGLIDIYSGGFAFIADTIRNGFQIAVDEAELHRVLRRGGRCEAEGCEGEEG
jgi:hypothetical protein